MSTALTTTDRINNLRGMLEKAKPRLMEVAPKHLKVERLTRLLLSAGSRNPKILDCSPESVLQFAMKCSETGLEPIGAGGMWAIPYENRKNNTVELQAIPDYRGLANCAKRAECIKDAYAEVVRKNDEFDYALGLEPHLTHKPARGDRGELEAAYCIIVFPDDTKRFVVMDKSEVEGIRKRSRASQSGPWVTDEAEMWKKTVMRRALKPFAGASPELDEAINLTDRATGLVDVTPREPIPMPTEKRVVEAATEPTTPTETPSEPADNGATEKEDTLPMGNEPTADTKQVKATVEAEIARTGKQPHKFRLVGGMEVMTFDDKIANEVRKLGAQGDISITYTVTTTHKAGRDYTNNVIQKVEASW